MFCGFDFGTSHCAVGVYQNRKVELVPLDKGHAFMPSNLYAFDRGLISQYNYQLMQQSGIEAATDYLNDRHLTINKAAQLRREHDLLSSEQACFVGQTAIDEYLEFPEEGYFVKSPKSFLGASGLQANQIQFFEDLVTAMMLTVKLKSEQYLNASLNQVVIGRPVNFQGINSDKSNQQAVEILTSAAKRCGYKQIEFMYEPLAAGIDFEGQLNSEKIVLVVDIGGGTTDCSIVKMGPKAQQSTNRQADFLAHTGRRVGGNDIDIHLAMKSLMPLFGLGGLYKTGTSLPNSCFWNAVAINSVVEQTEFYSQKNYNTLDQLTRDAEHGSLIKRLIKLQKTKQNHRLVREAEQAKIALSDKTVTSMNLDFIEAELTQDINVDAFSQAIIHPLSSIQALVKDAIVQANTQPDLIYLTGGSAKSAILRQAVIQAVKDANSSQADVPIYDGDYFGSVTTGLTKWAQRIFS